MKIITLTQLLAVQTNVEETKNNSDIEPIYKVIERPFCFVQNHITAFVRDGDVTHVHFTGNHVPVKETTEEIEGKMNDPFYNSTVPREND